VRNLTSVDQLEFGPEKIRNAQTAEPTCLAAISFAQGSGRFS